MSRASLSTGRVSGNTLSADLAPAHASLTADSRQRSRRSRLRVAWLLRSRRSSPHNASALEQLQHSGARRTRDCRSETISREARSGVSCLAAVPASTAECLQRIHPDARSKRSAPNPDVTASPKHITRQAPTAPLSRQARARHRSSSTRWRSCDQVRHPVKHPALGQHPAQILRGRVRIDQRRGRRAVCRECGVRSGPRVRRAGRPRTIPSAWLQYAPEQG